MPEWAGEQDDLTSAGYRYIRPLRRGNRFLSTISDKALAHAKHHILDTLGVALAALPTPVARIAIGYCQRAGVQETNSKVRVIVDETIPESSTYCPVGIHLKDGTRFTYTTAIAKGHPKNPMSESEVLDKFRSNAEAMLTVPSLEALISTAQRLESLSKAREIVDLLNPA